MERPVAVSCYDIPDPTRPASSHDRHASHLKILSLALLNTGNEPVGQPREPQLLAKSSNKGIISSQIISLENLELGAPNVPGEEVARLGNHGGDIRLKILRWLRRKVNIEAEYV